ncbi:hypothetical protein CKSOR_00375 [Candidatus Kinetoplastibacterium sorsogonicusi]|uniref:Ancillary SecYEG translocon subunit/Cell division coordinator CpoB TPR domain-containing protein n=2 Tax=Candidatus Kinetoplastidibacterium kentomonadis TaxID=1576550 RepID=A0A3S7J9Y9_9PROT|nr:hypothetical protein CKSOR_00375 [Candidatus Kinetoplastibacterium sorsogonicusi]
MKNFLIKNLYKFLIVISLILLPILSYLLYIYIDNKSQYINPNKVLENIELASFDEKTSIEHITNLENILASNFNKNLCYPYGTFLATRFLSSQGHIQESIDMLNIYIQQSKNSILKNVALFRKSGLLLEQKKYEEAIFQLNNPNKYFENLFNDRKADILICQGKIKEGLFLLNKILEKLDKNDPLIKIISLKIDALKSL